MEKHPLHLKQPDLHTSSEVERAVERQERHTGEAVANDPAERIEAYTDRLGKIFLNENERVRERNLEMFRDTIYDNLLIKQENFPDSYFELQQRIARERGQAVETIPEATKEQMKDVAIEDQKASLDSWIDYLTSDDAVYPAWFKYYVWKNITKLSQFDKERGEFKQRTKTTVAPFPDIYREPLAQLCDLYLKVKEDNKSLKDPEIQELFSKKFPSAYAELIQKSLAAQIENKEEIQGQWVKYEQGKQDQAEKLFQSLEGKGTGWCTAGRSTAKTQINQGDFYVYYTNDSSGMPTQPRLAIRMDGQDKIGEVRGILPHQNVEPQMTDILNEKLKDFGSEADSYRKKSEDMRKLTEIEKKTEANQPLNKDDLTFLYELNAPIQGFGYYRDPRIEQLRATRNPEADMSILFDCTPEQIAHSVSEIREDTKAYIGPLESGIFGMLPSTLEHVYTKFPEGRIKFRNIELGTGIKDGPAFQKVIEAQGMKVYTYAQQLLKSPDFTVVGERQNADLVEVSVGSLGFTSYTRYDTICASARELGLELCPAEVGPQLRLQYTNQPQDEYLAVAMNAICDRVGNPNVFDVYADDDGLWLDTYDGRAGSECVPDGRFVFLRPRK